ncbi:MAG: hypothetical protein HIU81_11250 [Acidobacteria bacterium]|nr:hypothetical protein [Acidobacteriota bacterium]
MDTIGNVYRDHFSELLRSLDITGNTGEGFKVYRARTTLKGFRKTIRELFDRYVPATLVESAALVQDVDKLRTQVEAFADRLWEKNVEDDALNTLSRVTGFLLQDVLEADSILMDASTLPLEVAA